MTARQERLREQAERAIRAQTEALALRESGHLEWLADDPRCPNLIRLAALTEELGEVARALQDDDAEQISTELAQLAGIALAWMSAIA